MEFLRSLHVVFVISKQQTESLQAHIYREV